MSKSASNQDTQDEAEIAKFSSIADDWWNPTGKFKPLHKLFPVRLSYIKELSCEHFAKDKNSTSAFQGLNIVDVGCGGGLLTEPMKRLGAKVVGIDPSESNIQAAKSHAEKMNLSIDYRAETAEKLVKNREKFDIVLNMEVVEHVADVPLFMSQCAKLVKPGGLMFVSTINRTLKAYLLAIVGAEQILRWLPKGTHTYEKFLKPKELETLMTDDGLNLIDECGVVFNPLYGRWNKSHDMDVNYMLCASRST